MMRVTTLYAGSAAATAKYYTQYLTQAPGEEPGKWLGAQAAELGLSGTVSAEALELLLTGRDPISGTTLGYPLKDRALANGSTIRAVAGFDATLSAPKSVSAWWALTGDAGIAECHDVAVRAVVEYIERFGSTTRIRSNGRRLHPDSKGLIVAAFRQTTSRMDDPQLHTNVVISAKVKTENDRWLALDARVLKRHQRALGGLYQSVLRAEVTSRYGVGFDRIVNGMAEIEGVPAELIEQFSKRAAQVRDATVVKIAEFRRREGRDPSRFEHAALEREAAVDTRNRKTGNGVPDLRSRWREEAADIGNTPHGLTRSIIDAGRATAEPAVTPTVGDVIADLSESRSAWHRLDVLRVVTDRLRPQANMSGQRWVRALDRAIDRVLDACVDLDPANEGVVRRTSDGRSPWIEPVAAHVTSHQVLAQEEAILAWTLDAQLVDPEPSRTIDRAGLDVLQASAAAAVAGHDDLVVIVGPAGAGKTTMLRAAVSDLRAHGREVFGVAPTAKAARVLERETGMTADTVAKLLLEWSLPDGPRPTWLLPGGTTLVVDEAGMLSTPDMYRLTQLATSQHWRLALVGDPRQLQAVGRGGMLAELCSTARTVELERIHRFTSPWEAAASLRLRHGDPRALDAYEFHQRIIPGTLDEQLDMIANAWIERHAAGETLAVTTTTNDHVNSVNELIQTRRIEAGDLEPSPAAAIVDSGRAMIGDVIATRRNNRQLHTSTGDTVRNRELWTVTEISGTGDLTVTQIGGQGTVTLPADYVREHVRLGYAATEHGNQSDTQTASLTLATPATTGRGLYVAMTRGREDNTVLVVTNTHDIGEARAVLETIIATDRADLPAVAQRRELAAQDLRVPRLQPRCEIPDWYQDCRDQAVANYRHARHDLDESRDKRDRFVADVEIAKAGLDAANLACAPFDAERDAAAAALKQAEGERRTAEHRLDQSGLRGRRRARTELSIAEERVAGAREALTVCEQRSARPFAARTTARKDLERARDNIRSHDLLDRMSYRPERVEQAEARIDALDTWHGWAAGNTVTIDQVAETVEVLSHARELPGAAELADAATRWAASHGHQLTPERAVKPRNIDLGIDL
jgi:conjugative relaxase-like TrwC/TraI family protein